MWCGFYHFVTLNSQYNYLSVSETNIWMKLKLTISSYIYKFDSNWTGAASLLDLLEPPFWHVLMSESYSQLDLFCETNKVLIQKINRFSISVVIMYNKQMRYLVVDSFFIWIIYLIIIHLALFSFILNIFWTFTLLSLHFSFNSFSAEFIILVIIVYYEERLRSIKTD